MAQTRRKRPRKSTKASTPVNQSKNPRNQEIRTKSQTTIKRWTTKLPSKKKKKPRETAK